MIKPAFCMCGNKDADQLYSKCISDQRLCSVFATQKVLSLFFLITNFKLLAIFYIECTGLFVLDLVRNPEARFSCNIAHFIDVSQFHIFNLRNLHVYRNI